MPGSMRLREESTERRREERRHSTDFAYGGFCTRVEPELVGSSRRWNAILGKS